MIGATQPSELLVERRGAALWLTLCRPAQLNALNPAVVAALDDHIRAAETDDTVRAVVVTGAGRAFCAGADIGSPDSTKAATMPPATEQEHLMVFLEQVAQLTFRIERCPKPVLAAVNGTALAGGLELMLACDLVFAAASAKIGDGHARYGLMPGGGSTARLPRKLAPAKASYLLMTGELLPATDPLLADLFTRVVPDDELIATVDACVETLASRSPLVLRHMKALAAAALDRTIESAVHAEREANGRHFHSADRREGLEAFRAKRAPVFVGR